MSDALRRLLRAYRDGHVEEEEILEEVVYRPFEEHDIGRIDHHREIRCGIPEVILAEGKRPQAVAALFEAYLERGEQLIATRVDQGVAEALAPFREELYWGARGCRVVATQPPPAEPALQGAPVAVVWAGALDEPVAEEAACCGELFGDEIIRLGDVGVAGLNRLLPELGRLRRASVVIAVAGMEGALPSVLSGLLPAPLIAVPTSVGYGASFGGLAALLTMLNGCAPGGAVVNIDNGFGAAAMAHKIARMVAG